ncbi:MAG TPA: nucleotide pyrophosphatase/phosphodiesterase family protein [Candidatus Bathyarchaeia archaeon]|nr:nucleotide pyrophosphatase/phosphodiesterase family protein [Candidatus Bathyarchaeia archaeon]
MIKYHIVIDIVGLEFDHLQYDIIPNISRIASEGECAKMEPVFPSVTCTVQASLLSGTYPSEHGIISNGLYDRTNHNISFWEQSSNLVKTDKVWDVAKKNSSNKPKAIKTAVLFWQNTMHCKANIVVTPRPLHFDDGMVMWCYSKPVGYYDQQLKTKFGEFNLATYWGPFASHKSSEWISQATTYTLEEHRPNLLFTYIPHIDYSAQRFGKRSSQVKDDLKIADGIVEEIVQKTIELGIKDESQFIILSEYGFNDVSSAIPLNLRLRDAGLLATRRIQDKEYLDYEFSNAFAMADHQIAHIYVKDGFANQAKHALENVTGVDRLLYGEDKKLLKIDHERSGDIIAISDKDKWFSYYWWYEPERAPTFAKNVDIHRKPGYDPVELFIDPNTRSISQDTSLVKGSHGRLADATSGEGLAVYISNRKKGILKNNNTCDTVKAVDIGKYLISLVS